MTDHLFHPFDPDAKLLEEDADAVLLGLLARDNEPPPCHPPYRQRNHETARAPAFDVAAYRRHMQDVIARREAAAQDIIAAREAAAQDVIARREAAAKQREAAARDAFARERAELDRIIGYADKPKPPPKPSVGPPKPQPGATLASPPLVWPPPPRQNVEPWFDPTRTPTPGDMRCIAQYALNYFTAARGLAHAGWTSVKPAAQMAHAICARDADAIAHVLMRLARDIPQSARFSAYPLPVPPVVLAATITSDYLSLQVASVDDGQKVSMAIMFDDLNAGK